MAITFVAAGTKDALSGGGSSGTVHPLLPTGGNAPAAGDLIVVACFMRRQSGSGDWATPSGYTEIVKGAFSVFTCTAIYYKVAAGGDADPDVDFSGNSTSGSSILAQTYVFRGADGTTPVLNNGGLGEGTPSDPTAPGFTPSAGAGLVIGFAAQDNDVTISSHPSGWTTGVQDTTTLGSDSSIIMDYLAYSSGSTSDAAWDTSGTTGWQAVQIALKTSSVSASITGAKAAATASAPVGVVSTVRTTSVSGAVATAAGASVAGAVATIRIVSVSGATAIASAAAVPGAVEAQVTIAVSGSAATANAAAVAGIVDITTGGVAITGVTASASASALPGVITPVVIPVNVSVTGVTASAASNANTGTVEAQRATSVTGSVATASAASLEGSVEARVNVSVTGSPATATSAAVEAVVSTVNVASVSGVAAAAAADATAAVVTSVGIVIVSGATATAGAASPAGTVEAHVDAVIVGGLPAAIAASIPAAITAISYVSITAVVATASAAAATGAVSSSYRVRFPKGTPSLVRQLPNGTPSVVLKDAMKAPVVVLRDRMGGASWQ